MEVTVSNSAIEIPLQKADADTRMSKRDAIERATLYLYKQGYSVEWTSERGIDIIARSDEGGGTLALVAVQPFTGKAFPMNPFTDTKAHRNRFYRLTAGATRYIARTRYKGLLRLDSVLVRNDGTLDHCRRKPHRVGSY